MKLESGWFEGVYEARLDGGGRVRLPEEWPVDPAGERYVVPWSSRGLPAIAVLGLDGWKEWRDDLHAGEGCDLEGEEGAMEWALHHAMRQSGGDGGSLLLPESLLGHAGLDRGCEVNLVGRGRHFEVWCPEHFRHVWEMEDALLEELNRELGFF